MAKKKKLKNFKVMTARGGDAAKSDAASGRSAGRSSPSGGGGGRDRDYQQRGMSKADYAKSKQTQNFGGRDTKSKIGPVVKDVPFKPPLTPVQSLAVSQIIPFGGPLVNYAAKQNYKGRQKFAQKQGLYRDAYKTTGKVLQPNAPIGKQYLKDAGFGKPKTNIFTSTGGEGKGLPTILPPVSQVAQVNEPLDPLLNPLSSYKRPTVTNGRFNYSVGFKKGGMLRQGKPKLAKKGWK